MFYIDLTNMPAYNKRNCCTTINTTQLSTKEKKHKNTNIDIQALIYPFFIELQIITKIAAAR